MKLCVISDVHGLTLWEDIVELEIDNVDRFIFLGDYVDDKDDRVSPEQQIDNFQSIVEFAKEEGSTDLLIGNHDLQYMGGARCKGFNSGISSFMHDYLLQLVTERKIGLCVQYGSYLFSHAGISREWMREKGLYKLSDINPQFHTHPMIGDFINKIDGDISGDNHYQSPLWIRPDSLMASAVSNVCHVVGHTRIQTITPIEQNQRKLIFTDTQLKQYLLIDTELQLEEIRILE